MDDGLRGGSVGELAGWLAGWLAARPAGWWVGGWLAGRIQNAYRWPILSIHMRFMPVLSTFSLAYGAGALRGLKNMQKRL